MKNIAKVEKEHSTPRAGSNGGFHVFGLANYMIFGAPGGHPIYACEPFAMCGRNFLSILNTSVVTDRENTN